MALWVLVGLVCALVPTASAQLILVAGREAVRGFAGDGGAALEATLALSKLQNECDPGRLEQVSQLSVDGKGNLYIADSGNQRIRRIDPDGTIRTVAGSGSTPSINARCEASSAPLDGGSALDARLYGPSHAVVAPNGNLIIADQQNNRIRQVTPAGVITTIAGSGQHNLYAPGIPAALSPMDWPTSLAVDAAGLIYFSEIHSNRIGRLGADGRITTMAGTGFPGYNGENVRGTAAMLRKPAGLAFDKDGNLLIADSGNHRVRRLSAAGIVTTVAGSGQQGDCGDGGRATEACLDTPLDVKADARGNIYIADAANHRVRRVDAAGNISTLAAGLNYPTGLAVTEGGDVYIADGQNFVIRLYRVGALTSVRNAASGLAAVAPGSMIEVRGTNLAGLTVNGLALPVVSVTNDLSVVLAQLPYELEPGVAALRVGEASFDLTVVAGAPGIYTLEDRAVARNEDGQANSPERPERPGRQLTLVVTGLGLVSPPVATGQEAGEVVATAVQAVTATVGGVAAEVVFAGLAPAGLGVGVVRVVVPADAAEGAAVPVVLRMGDVVSNAALVSIGKVEP